jgi:hypothetical protein
MKTQMSSVMDADAFAELLPRMHQIQYMSAFSLPVVLFLRLCITSFILYAALVLTGAETTFRTALCVNTHSVLPMMVDGSLRLLVIWIAGTAAYQTPEAVQASTGGLNLLLGTGSHPALNALLNGLNLFALWSFGLRTIGLTVTCGARRGQAMAAAAVLWILELGLATAAAALLAGAQALHGS